MHADNHRHITKWITLLSRGYQQYMIQQLEPLGLGTAHYYFLFVVCEEPGIVQDKLSERFILNKSTVARSVAQLETNGYLTRKINPLDKRAYLLYPTEKAISSLEKIRDLVSQGMGTFLQDFAEDEVVMLENLLKRMLHNMRRECVDTPITLYESRNAT